MMNRDKQILHDLERFRCLTRDGIADLYFSHTKHPITQANLVLKRLRRDKYITASTERRKYIYFPADKHIKKDSQKVNHFLAIAEFYKQIRKVDEPKRFIVEPKYGKGNIEPDVFMVWCGHAWHVEIQRTVYSDKQMKEKLDRYDSYHLNRLYEGEDWQPEGRKVAPMVWITGVGHYNIGIRSFRVYQDDVSGMTQLLLKKKPS
jgi:hypothetical protein